MTHAPTHSDLIALARLVRSKPRDMRGWVTAQVLHEARSARRWINERSACHPAWGDGTVMAAALRRGNLPHYGLEDADYCDCLAVVAQAVARLPQASQRSTIVRR